MPLSDIDRDLLIRTVIGEAADQGERGQSAVIHTVLNRLEAKRYGKNVAQIVLAKNQYEPWSTRANRLLSYKPTDKAYQSVSGVLDKVLSGELPDETGGSTHFLSPSIMQARGAKLPKWAQSGGVAIGGHTFFAPEGKVVAKKKKDLLDDYLEASETNDGEKPSNAAATPSEGPDLLEQYLTATDGEQKPTKKPVETREASTGGKPVGVADLPQSEEALGQAIPRLIKEHGSDSVFDKAARGGLGAVRGIGDVADTLAQGITGAGAGGAGLLERLGIINPDTAQGVRDWRSRVNADISADNKSFDEVDNGMAGAGRIGGQLLATAPIGGAASSVLTKAAPAMAARMAARPVASSLVRGGAGGVGANLLTSASSDAPLSDQLAVGGAAGSVLGPAGHAAGKAGGFALRNLAKLLYGNPAGETAKLATSAMSPLVSQMQPHGTPKPTGGFDIPLRAGQISDSHFARFFDSVLSKLPGTGFGKNAAAQQGALNNAVAHEMGYTAGAEKLTPKVMQDIKSLHDANYDFVRANSEVKLDKGLTGDLNGIKREATKYLGSDASKIHNLIDEITGKIRSTSSGKDTTGRAYQSITEDSSALSRLMKSNNSEVAGRAQDIKRALDAARDRHTHPDIVKIKKDTDYQYAVRKSVEDMVGKGRGNVSPAGLLGAVNNNVDGLAYGKGGRMAELGHIGQRFMKEPASSGTMERLSVLAPLAAAGAGAFGINHFDPDNFQRDAAVGTGLAGLGFLGTRGASSRYLAKSLVRPRMSGYSSVFGNMVEKGAPLAGLLAREPLRITVNPRRSSE